MTLPRKSWTMILRMALTAVVIGVLFQFVDWRKIVATLAQADLIWLVPAYAVIVGRRAMEAWQQALVLRCVECRLTWFRVFRANALAVFYALFSPGSFIPIAVKWTDLAAAAGKGAIVLNAMVYNRVMLDVPPIIIGAVVLAWANPMGNPTLALAAFGLGCLGTMFAVCLFAPWAAQMTRRAFAAVSQVLPGALRKRVARIVDELEPFRAFSSTRHLWLGAIALASFAVGIAARVMIMKSLGFEVPLSTLIWVDAILVVAAHIPITLGNFGVREGIVIAAFGLHGISADVAVAYGLLLYGSRIVFALVGGVYQLALISGFAAMRGDAPARRLDKQPARFYWADR